MEKSKIVTEILSLVDSHPLDEVDIKDILMKYSEGLEISQQQELRHQFAKALTDLKRRDEITYSDADLSTLFRLDQTEFAVSSLLISSTIARDEKIKKQNIVPVQNIRTYTTHGDKSPISEHDTNISDIKNKTVEKIKESEESKELTNKQLADHPKLVWYRKKAFIISIIAIVIALLGLIAIWIGKS